MNDEQLIEQLTTRINRLVNIEISVVMEEYVAVTAALSQAVIAREMLRKAQK